MTLRLDDLKPSDRFLTHRTAAKIENALWLMSVPGGDLTFEAAAARAGYTTGALTQALTRAGIVPPKQPPQSAKRKRESHA